MQFQLNSTIAKSLYQLQKSFNVIDGVLNINLLASDLDILTQESDGFTTYVNIKINGNSYEKFDEERDNDFEYDNRDIGCSSYSIGLHYLIHQIMDENEGDMVTIEFEFYGHDVLNKYFEDYKSKESLKFLCDLAIKSLYHKGESLTRYNDKRESFNLIKINNSEELFREVVDGEEYLQLLNSWLFDNRIREILNQCCKKYEEKLSFEKYINCEIDKILEY